jgi:serine protease AprX
MSFVPAIISKDVDLMNNLKPHLPLHYYFLFLIFLTTLLLPISPLAQGNDGRHRRMSRDLWKSLEHQPSDPSGEKIEQIIVSSDQLSHDKNVSAILARHGAKLKKMNDSTGLMTVEIASKNIPDLLTEARVNFVSMDRNVTATGHLDTTTGATLARTISGYQDLDGSGIGIAILDSGIDSRHELFNRNLSSVTSYSSSSGTTIFNVNGTGAESSVILSKNFAAGDLFDLYGHGTLTASLISGRKEFLSGTYTGLAPNANLLNLKVLSDKGTGKASDVIAAIDWCIKNKALYNIRIINLSLGAPAVESYRTDPLCQAARRAFDAGIVVVAAAGNYGKSFSGTKLYGGISSPGIEPSVITVGASNTKDTDQRSDDLMASYSSRGPTRSYLTDNRGIRIFDNLPKPDLVAPGNRIAGANALGTPDKGNKPFYSNALVKESPSILIQQNPVIEKNMIQEVGIVRLSGTSMSAPLVSGTIALMLQANPNLTPSLVKAILMYSAQPLPGFNTLEQGAGELNVHGALSLTKLIKPSTATLKNGDYMLIGSLPVPQGSNIAGQSTIWGQAVISRYGFLYGNEVMLYWQGMYDKSSLIMDATSWQNGSALTLPLLVSNTVQMKSAVMRANGDSMSGGIPLASGIVFADNSTFSSGIVFADGRVVYDLKAFSYPLTGFSMADGD